MAVSDDGAEDIVAIGEDIGFDDDGFAGDSFDGVVARVKFGGYTLDDDPLTAVSWDGWRCWSGDWHEMKEMVINRNCGRGNGTEACLRRPGWFPV